MKTFLTLFILSIAHIGLSQKTEYIYKNTLDSSFNCYLTILPDSMEIRGLIVRDYSSLPKQNNKVSYPYIWKDLSLENGIAIVYTVSSNYFPELYYNDSGLVILDQLIQEVVEKHNIPKNNIFIGGISASGTRALRYAQYCAMGKSAFGTKIKGVFSVDSPLDYERFYNSAVRGLDSFKEGMFWEAKLMSKVFPEKMHGTPETNLSNYYKRSVFSYTDTSGGNAKLLLKTPLLFFHEPDMDWWYPKRGAHFYDINSFDITGMYQFLKENRHKDLEIITTTQKGFDREGKRNCHSWSIVDERYLIHWITKRLD